MLSPKPDDANLQSPFRLQLKFEGRGGAQIDPESLKLIYVKKSAVDLTARVKPFVKPAGIDLLEASVPPGITPSVPRLRTRMAAPARSPS